MSLKDKASKIAFTDLDVPAAPAREEPSPALPVAPRARSGVAAISQSIGIHHRVQDLEAIVSQYEQGGAVVMLDPARIGPNGFKNRHELSYETDSFKSLKAEIEAAGRNVQPIKVRKIVGGDGRYDYEIVFGRRRHRACLELGLKVAAIVQVMTDVELFQEMERENRNRADLSAWEQGVMYKDAIDRGLYASQRQMAAALTVDQGNLSKAIRLASLPTEIVGAFPSPLDLQFRWGADLADALVKDPARLLVEAQRLQALVPKLAAKEVYSQLIGASEVSARPATADRREFSVDGKLAAVWTREVKGAAALKVKPGALNATKEKRLVEFLDRLFS